MKENPPPAYIGNGSIESIRLRLQHAIKLEHATIPAYLTALYSLKPGTNQDVAQILQSIVIEEMTHMALAANVLNAVGGQPIINRPEFVPNYPSKLPEGIRPDVTLGLERLTLPLVKNTFMSLEAPHDPLDPARLKRARHDPHLLLADPGGLHYEWVEYKDTIGEFYRALEADIEALDEGAFVNDRARQLDYAPVIVVTDRKSALEALRLIVDQGEGTDKDPFEKNTAVPAHFYRFEEIVRGRRLIRTPDGTARFDGDPVVFDQASVWPMIPNTKRADIEDGTQAADRLDAFNGAYWRLLNALHDTFNGDPKRFNAAMGLMYEVKATALRLVETPVPGARGGVTMGPSFEYMPQAGL